MFENGHSYLPLDLAFAGLQINALVEGLTRPDRCSGDRLRAFLETFFLPTSLSILKAAR